MEAGAQIGDVYVKKSTSKGKAYRDGLFSDYFNDRTRLRSLVNALFDANIERDKEIVINTLVGVFFNNTKNDISCIAKDRFLVIVEQQSMPNENMPIRMLVYAAELITRIVAPYRKELYKGGKIVLPAPQFVMFYNGNTMEPERQILRLSDVLVEKEFAGA